MSNSSQTIAAANALSGEKTFRTISFAITGDSETDLIAAVVACVESACASETYENSFSRAARVLGYLSKRYSDGMSAAEKYQSPFQQAQSARNMQSSPNAVPPQLNIPWFTVHGGALGSPCGPTNP